MCGGDRTGAGGTDASVDVGRAPRPEVSRAQEEVLGRGQTGQKGEVQHTGGVWNNGGHFGVVEEKPLKSIFE